MTVLTTNDTWLRVSGASIIATIAGFAATWLAVHVIDDRGISSVILGMSFIVLIPSLVVLFVVAPLQITLYLVSSPGYARYLKIAALIWFPIPALALYSIGDVEYRDAGFFDYINDHGYLVMYCVMVGLIHYKLPRIVRYDSEVIFAYIPSGAIVQMFCLAVYWSDVGLLSGVLYGRDTVAAYTYILLATSGLLGVSFGVKNREVSSKSNSSF